MMSEQSPFDQRVMMYSDEASIANGSGINGESTVPIVAQAVEEPKTRLAPQPQIQLVAMFFW